MLKAGFPLPKRLRLCKKTVNNNKTIHAKWILACLHYPPLYLLVTSEADVLERLPPSAPSTQREPPPGGSHAQELWAGRRARPPCQTSFLYQTRSGFITSFMATSGSFPSSPFFFFLIFHLKSFLFSSVPRLLLFPLCSLEIVSTAVRASPTVTTCVRGWKRLAGAVFSFSLAAGPEAGSPRVTEDILLHHLLAPTACQTTRLGLLPLIFFFKFLLVL